MAVTSITRVCAAQCRQEVRNGAVSPASAFLYKLYSPAATQKVRNLWQFRKLTPQPLERDARHSEVECTYSIIEDEAGKRYLQLDTYGSNERKFPGKKSQSLRFTPEAIKQLRALLADKF